MTLQQVNEVAGFSHGMLSKMENAIVSPSIATLSFVEALDVSISEFFAGHEDAGTVFFPKTKRQNATSLPRCNEIPVQAFDYEMCNPSLLSTGKTFRFTLQDYRGEQFAYMLEGEMEYVVSDKVYTVQEEDNVRH